jgi:hypothetical protein
VAVGLVVDVGTLPRAELLGAIEGGIRYRRVEVTLRAAVGPAEDTTDGDAAGARLMPASATLTPCYAPLVTGRLRLGPCGQIEVGLIHAEGIGISQSRVTDAPWLSLGGELAMWLVLGAHFELRVDAGALVPVVRPNFGLTGLGDVFEPGVAARGGGAAVVRF